MPNVVPHERWKSPLLHTIAYELFRQHLTEINNIYWSFVPANETIKKEARIALESNNGDPRTFFSVNKTYDRRLANSYKEWKQHNNDFENYTRLSMVMLLSSCFETYLRTIISLAFESKPGVIFHDPDSVDGLQLLQRSLSYGDNSRNNEHAVFASRINHICEGDWEQRIKRFEDYFGQIPETFKKKKSDLEKMRKLRNKIAHQFGREDDSYEMPLLFDSKEAIRVSHDRLLKLFQLVDEIVECLDNYLKDNFIGSYDIIKLFYEEYVSRKVSISPLMKPSKALQEYLGKHGHNFEGKKAFCQNMMNYYGLPQI